MQEIPPPLRPSRSTFLARLTLVGVALAIMGLFFASGAHRLLQWDQIQETLDSLRETVRDHLGISVFVFFLIYLLATAFSLPSAAGLTLLSGALFGRGLGTMIASLASTLGATLAMLMSRFVLRDWVERRFGKRIVLLRQGMEKEGPYYLFVLRLLPIVPFFLINLGMGLISIRATTFAAVSWLGMLPVTFLYVNAGTELAALKSPADILSPSLLTALALVGIVPLILKRLVHRPTEALPDAQESLLQEGPSHLSRTPPGSK